MARKVAVKKTTPAPKPGKPRAGGKVSASTPKIPKKAARRAGPDKGAPTRIEKMLEKNAAILGAEGLRKRMLSSPGGPKRIKAKKR